MVDFKALLPISVRVKVHRLVHRVTWKSTGYQGPAPQHVKIAVLRRYGNVTGTWVESGTYLGDTTALLARKASRVYTIEPSTELASRARHRFKDDDRVQVLEGLSENVLPTLLPQLTSPVSFWLDGHTSGGMTHLGPRATPIREELAAIEAELSRLGQIVVLIDDVRGFGSKTNVDGAYPSRSFLVHWADRNGLNWAIEHDIFAAWTQ